MSVVYVSMCFRTVQLLWSSSWSSLRDQQGLTSMAPLCLRIKQLSTVTGQQQADIWAACRLDTHLTKTRKRPQTVKIFKINNFKVKKIKADFHLNSCRTHLAFNCTSAPRLWHWTAWSSNCTSVDEGRTLWKGCMLIFPVQFPSTGVASCHFRCVVFICSMSSQKLDENKCFIQQKD